VAYEPNEPSDPQNLILLSFGEALASAQTNSWLVETPRKEQAWEGKFTVRKPVHLQVDGGHPLFYYGINWLYGAGGSGKTTVAGLYAAEGLLNEETVCWINCESPYNLMHTINLLKFCKVSKEAYMDQFCYLQIEDQATNDVLDGFFDELARRDVSRVVIDSFGQLLPQVSPHGKVISGDDFNAFTNSFMKRLRMASEPSVVVIDHTPHGGKEAFGSVYKKNNVDGHYILMEVQTPFSKNDSGFSTLKTQKDNNGVFTVDKVAAELHVQPDHWMLINPNEEEATETESIIIQTLKVKKSCTKHYLRVKNVAGKQLNLKTMEKALLSLISKGKIHQQNDEYVLNLIATIDS